MSGAGREKRGRKSVSFHPTGGRAARSGRAQGVGAAAGAAARERARGAGRAARRSARRPFRAAGDRHTLRAHSGTCRGKAAADAATGHQRDRRDAAHEPWPRLPERARGERRGRGGERLFDA